MVRQGNAAPEQAERAGPSPRQVEDGVPPAQRVGGSVRQGVGQQRQDEAFGVPEGMSVVSGTGQAFGGDGSPLGAGAGLQHVEQAEPDRLLQHRVTDDFDVRGIPELVEVGALFG
jgi:hypothetical protein